MRQFAGKLAAKNFFGLLVLKRFYHILIITTLVSNINVIDEMIRVPIQRGQALSQEVLVRVANELLATATR